VRTRSFRRRESRLNENQRVESLSIARRGRARLLESRRINSPASLDEKDPGRGYRSWLRRRRGGPAPSLQRAPVAKDAINGSPIRNN